MPIRRIFLIILITLLLCGFIFLMVGEFAVTGPHQITIANQSGLNLYEFSIGSQQLLTQPLADGESVTVSLGEMSKGDLWDSEVSITGDDFRMTVTHGQIYPGNTVTIYRDSTGSVTLLVDMTPEEYELFL